MKKQVDEVKNRRLSDAYAAPVFGVLQRVDSHEFDRRIFVLTLARHSKTGAVWRLRNTDGPPLR
jgi:hypothetical protein